MVLAFVAATAFHFGSAIHLVVIACIRGSGKFGGTGCHSFGSCHMYKGGSEKLVERVEHSVIQPVFLIQMFHCCTVMYDDQI